MNYFSETESELRGKVESQAQKWRRLNMDPLKFLIRKGDSWPTQPNYPNMKNHPTVIC